MKNFPLITKYIDELSILEANLSDVENGRCTVDDAVGEAYDFYAEAMYNAD